MSLKVPITLILLVTLVASNPFEENDIVPLQSALGSTRVLLDGASCKKNECNLGNFLADAIIDWNALQYAGSVGWTDSAISMIDAQTIKASIARGQTGEISSEHIDEILQGSTIVAVNVTGQEIIDALEHSVKNYEIDSDAAYDEFLQVSGLFVEYDMSKPAGQRVVNVEIVCADCNSPLIFTINRSRTYEVLMPQSLANGAHGYTMFDGKIVRDLVMTDKEMFVSYLAKKSPIYPAVEWRITIFPEPQQDNSTTTTTTTTTTTSTDTTPDSGMSFKISFAAIFASIVASILNGRF